jgi:hypothetical protein
MADVVPETLHIVMSRITRRAPASANALSVAEMQRPHVDKPAVEAAMWRYFEARSERLKRLRWFADGRTARAYIREHEAVEPTPAYWPDISIARALDLAWFAGAMRPPIKIYKNRSAATRDWES